MKKTFKRCKSAGYKKVHHRSGDGYAGLSKRQVLKCITSNDRLRKFNVRFVNKAKCRPLSVKRLQEQHQIDLVDMKSMKVEYKGKCYEYFFRWWTYFCNFIGLLHLRQRKVVIWKRNSQGSVKNMDNQSAYKVTMGVNSNIKLRIIVKVGK